MKENLLLLISGWINEKQDFNHMTAISKNVYFDGLDDIVNKYNNTVHRSIKMRPIDVASDSSAEYIEDSNEKKS